MLVWFYNAFMLLAAKLGFKLFAVVVAIFLFNNKHTNATAAPSLYLAGVTCIF